MRQWFQEGDDGTGGASGAFSVKFQTFRNTPANAVQFAGFPAYAPAGPAPRSAGLGPGGGPLVPALPFFLNRSAAGDNVTGFDENCPLANPCATPPSVGVVLNQFSGAISTDPATGAQTGTLTVQQQGSGDLPITSYFVPPPPGGWAPVSASGESIASIFTNSLGYFTYAQLLVGTQTLIYDGGSAPPTGCIVIPTGLTGYTASCPGHRAVESLDTPDVTPNAFGRAGQTPLPAALDYSQMDDFDPLTGKFDGTYTNLTLSMVLA